MNLSYLKNLRIFSIIEGSSTLILFFIAMPLKYYFDLPIYVTIFGSIHGILFLILVAMFILAIKKINLSLILSCAGILCAIIPFGPFYFDRYLKKLEQQK